MGKTEQLREELIEASHAVDAYLDEHEGSPSLKADEQRELDRLMSEMKRKGARYSAAKGIDLALPDSPAEVKSWLSEAAGRGSTKGQGPIPFPGGGYSAELHAGRPTVHKQSWGEALVKSLTRDGYGSKDLLSPSGTVPVSVPLRVEPVADAQRAQHLRQLIGSEPAPGGHFSYLKQSTRTNNAAVVAEGARKPTSVYTLERIDDKVDTIAHLSEPIPRSHLSDAPMLRRFVDDELRYGLDLALDAEILAAIAAEAATGPGGADPLTAARKAITVLQQADFDPTGMAMSPGDWEAIELQALEDFASNPAMSPINAMTRRLFGVPVVVTTALDDGEGLIGDFRSGAVLYLTEEARIDWSENVYDPTFDSNVGATDFERNLIRFRAEMRAKTAVLRPLAFVSLALGS